MILHVKKAILVIQGSVCGMKLSEQDVALLHYLSISVSLSVIILPSKPCVFTSCSHLVSIAAVIMVDLLVSI